MEQGVVGPVRLKERQDGRPFRVKDEITLNDITDRGDGRGKEVESRKRIDRRSLRSPTLSLRRKSLSCRELKDRFL